MTLQYVSSQLSKKNTGTEMFWHVISCDRSSVSSSLFSSGIERKMLAKSFSFFLDFSLSILDLVLEVRNKTLRIRLKLQSPEVVYSNML